MGSCFGTTFRPGAKIGVAGPQLIGPDCWDARIQIDPHARPRTSR